MLLHDTTLIFEQFNSSIISKPRSELRWFNQTLDSIDFTNTLAGSSVFLIAGGPSLSEFNHALLKQPGCYTVALNNASKTVRPNLAITVDEPENFLSSVWMDPKITKLTRKEHHGKTLFDSESWMPLETTTSECPNVYYFDCNLAFDDETFLIEDSVNWGNEGTQGARSVLLAAIKNVFHLGAGHIFLLGVDFDMNADSPYHFPEHRSQSAINGNNNTYKILNTRLKALRPRLEAKQCFVWNCNQSSKLTAFPYCPFEEAIRFATRNFPASLEEETTRGLYERNGQTNESAEILNQNENLEHAGSRARNNW